MNRTVPAAVLAAFLISCSTAPPAPEMRILDAGQCWFTVSYCHDLQIVGAQREDGTYEIRVVTQCHDEWQARCREAELERYQRRRRGKDGKPGKPACSLVRLPDAKKIAVSCGGVP